MSRRPWNKCGHTRTYTIFIPTPTGEEPIKDKYEDIHYDQWWDVYYTYSKANIEQTEDVLSLISDLDDDLSKSNIIEMKKHICDVLEFMCSTETFSDSYEQHYLQKYALSLSTKGELTKKYEALVDEIRIKEPNYRTSEYQMLDPFEDSGRWDYNGVQNRRKRVFEYWKKKDEGKAEARRKAEIKKKRDEYWNEHKEEKERYETRLTEIRTEKGKLEETVHNYDEKIQSAIKRQKNKFGGLENEVRQIKKQIDDLSAELNGLGLFAGKKKKEIQTQISELSNKLTETEERTNRERETIAKDTEEEIASIEAEKKPYADKLSALEDEASNIRQELSKER